MAAQFAFFDTAIGRCGIGWNDCGIVCTQLPMSREADARRRLLRFLPNASEGTPPAAINAVITRIQTLLEGARDDLADIELEMADVPEFNRQVYAIARAIPPCATVTYGDIARRLGDIALARGVGQALGQNPFPIIVPCHRVLAAGDRPGGFSAPGGAATKLKMLAIEGAYVNHTPSLF